jgi:hypothetical protein
MSEYIKTDLPEVERGAWTGFIWLKIRTGGKLSSIKCGEFLHLLRTYLLTSHEGF